MAERKLTRREFLVTAGGAGLLACCGGIVGGEALRRVSGFLGVAPVEPPRPLPTNTPNFSATGEAFGRITPQAAAPTAEAQANVAPATRVATRTATRPAVAPAVENKPARQLSLTELRTPQQVFDAIFRPIDPNYPNARDLNIGEIQPDINKDGKQVGWRISRAKNQAGEPTFIPAFRVNLPRQFGMQWGFLDDVNQRNTIGLSLAEAKAIGLNPDAKGSGVPCDMDLYVEGLAISYDQSMFYGKLPLQTAFDRMNNPH